ncbi:MAG: hypothetical protein K5773_08165 [Pseudobutyrivibrio sp.]|nr:hypothetical protein [Pseudobutyrivibrio sp.]
MIKTDFEYQIDLENKNILIVMPKFYAYQAKMKADLIARGANPVFYDEEPEKTKFLVTKKLEGIFHLQDAFGKFNRQLVKRIIEEKPSEGYDYLLVIRGNVLTDLVIHEIKLHALKAGAKTIYYSWDAFANLRHKGELGRNFDRRATFDSVDAKDSLSQADDNLKYELLPLFYSDEFDAARLDEVTEYKYDYVSVSAWFPFRYRYFKAFAKANPDKKLCLKIVLDPKVYRGKKLTNPGEVSNLDMDIVTFDSFTADQIRDLVLSSRAVIDLAHEKQQGLTMRTMETLGIRRKLVTNNIYLKDYEFYNKESHVILEDLPTKADRAEATGDYSAFVLPGRHWLDAPYVGDETQRSHYSIHAWLDNLFR